MLQAFSPIWRSREIGGGSVRDGGPSRTEESSFEVIWASSLLRGGMLLEQLL